MSDTDEATDLETARNASFVAKCYTMGWRAYLEGRPCPKHPASERGWNEARHASEVCGRNIAWSMPLDSREKIWNDMYPKCY